MKVPFKNYYSFILYNQFIQFIKKDNNIILLQNDLI